MDVPNPQIKRYALVPAGRDGAVRRFRLERMEEVAGVGRDERDDVPLRRTDDGRPGGGPENTEPRSPAVPGA
jgi:hypothetical protein